MRATVFSANVLKYKIPKIGFRMIQNEYLLTITFPSNKNKTLRHILS